MVEDKTFISLHSSGDNQQQIENNRRCPVEFFISTTFGTNLNYCHKQYLEIESNFPLSSPVHLLPRSIRRGLDNDAKRVEETHHHTGFAQPTTKYGRVKSTNDNNKSYPVKMRHWMTLSVEKYQSPAHVDRAWEITRNEY